MQVKSIFFSFALKIIVFFINSCGGSIYIAMPESRNTASYKVRFVEPFEFAFSDKITLVWCPYVSRIPELVAKKSRDNL